MRSIAIRTLIALGALSQTIPLNLHAQEASTNLPPVDLPMPEEVDGGAVGEVEALEAVGGSDPTFILPDTPVESVIGFNKSILDTPRSVTVLSSELLSAAGIENVEDLYQVAPSTYSNFRFGLQGGINVRNQSGDYYFRGMKKPDPQGNYRTIFTAFDSVEVVRGPASPIYGGGRIGGYLNFNPKTARSVSGKYMDRFEGKVTMTVGSWNKRIAELDYGGPLNFIPNRRAGMYFYGYFEDSDSYWDTNFDEHLVGQLAVSMDINDVWRAETGIVVQDSRGGLNGGVNRVTEEFLKDGKYWRGGFAVNLDANGDGKISDRELFGSRPPDATYNPIFVNFGTVTGKPNFRQEVDATGRPVGPVRRVDTGEIIGSGSSALNNLPEPWQLDYDSFRLVNMDYSRTLGEDYYDALIFDVFLDLINDSDPALTMKNQIYFHTYNQIKDGRNPFSQIQKPRVLEDKFTVSHEADWQPSWLEGKFLASANLRFTDTYRENTTGGDYDQRRDLMSGPDGGFSPNDTFFSFINDREGLDGSAITQINDSQYLETGIGLLTDQTLFKTINIVGGGRFDYVTGDYERPPGVFLGKTSANVGRTADLENRITTTAFRESGNDYGLSWSASVSWLAPFNLRPYVTVAQQSALLVNTSDASIAASSWQNGAYARSELYEAGVKGSFFRDRLFATLAFYQQSRMSFSEQDGIESVDATESRGIELELRYVPVRNLSIVGSAVISEAEYLTGGVVRVNGRFVGFSDVIDPDTGRVLVPAEAFGWGGVPQVTIADGAFPEVEGIPDVILNLFATYTHSSGFGGSFGVTYQNGFYSDRTQIYYLPPATVLNASVFYGKGRWFAKVDFRNLTDELYFNKGANNGMMVGVREPFNVNATVAISF